MMSCRGFRARPEGDFALSTRLSAGWVYTQINRRSLPDIESLLETIADGGATSWELQLTVPLGRAADAVDDLLQPFKLLELFPRLAKLRHALRGEASRKGRERTSLEVRVASDTERISKCGCGGEGRVVDDHPGRRERSGRRAEHITRGR
jgi:hypothetical protein